jgi:glycosyltransferase involved in cell wall biosynthesis
MEEQIKISYIIPLYNCAKYIERCVRSIECQHPNSAVGYEIIVVDDGSTDGCADIVAEMAKSNLSIKLIHQKNSGCGPARNTGLSIAKGKYVYFVDADDILVSGTIEPQLEMMELLNLDTLSLSVSRISESDINDFVNSPLTELKFSEALDGISYLQKTNFLTNREVEVWHYIYSHDIIAKNNFKFEKLLNEDFVFDIDYFLSAKRIAKSNINTYLYINYPNSTIHQKRPFNIESNLGLATIWAVDQKIGLYNEILKTSDLLKVIQAYRDNKTFLHVLWPMVRECASVSSVRTTISQLKQLDAYPIGKPNNYKSLNFKTNKILNGLWHASRHYYLWLVIIFFNRLFRNPKPIDVSRKQR